MFKRLLALSLSLSIAATQLSAASYGDISVDDIWEYDAFAMTNPAVRVIRKDGRRILVRFLEGDRTGQTQWVLPSTLLTSDESFKQEAENIGTNVAVGVGIAFILFCLATPDAEACQ